MKGQEKDQKGNFQGKVYKIIKIFSRVKSNKDYSKSKND